MPPPWNSPAITTAPMNCHLHTARATLSTGICKLQRRASTHAWLSTRGTLTVHTWTHPPQNEGTDVSSAHCPATHSLLFLPTMPGDGDPHPAISAHAQGAVPRGVRASSRAGKKECGTHLHFQHPRQQGRRPPAGGVWGSKLPAAHRPPDAAPPPPATRCGRAAAPQHSPAPRLSTRATGGVSR
jgi:hypothetical protein